MWKINARLITENYGTVNGALVPLIESKEYTFDEEPFLVWHDNPNCHFVFIEGGSKSPRVILNKATILSMIIVPPTQ